MAENLASNNLSEDICGQFARLFLTSGSLPGIYLPMLIKFDSDAGTFIMDRTIGVRLLRAMGHSGTVPGAILPADIPSALERLKDLVGKTPAPDAAESANAEDESEVRVSLRQRAFPLIELLTLAAAHGKEVFWK